MRTTITIEESLFNKACISANKTTVSNLVTKAL